jgi:hypothetical protein
VAWLQNLLQGVQQMKHESDDDVRSRAFENDVQQMRVIIEDLGPDHLTGR